MMYQISKMHSTLDKLCGLRDREYVSTSEEDSGDEDNRMIQDAALVHHETRLR